MENTPKPQSQEPKNEPKQTSRLNTYLLYLLFICAGIAVTKFSFDFITPRFAATAKSAPRTAATPVPAPPRPAVTTAAPVTSPQAAIDAVKKKVKQVVEPFELNGVYISGEETYALVNNKIVQVGDQVDGATVTKISDEEVVLNRDNRDIRLQSRNR